MHTVEVEILNEKAVDLLLNLQQLKLIKVRDKIHLPASSEPILALKGTMTKQTPEEIDKQFNALREEWD